MSILLLAGSYLLGAIPTSYLAGRWFRGIDLREHGSRNLGATNVYRVLGWQFAVPVGLFDVAKGAIPVLAARALVPEHALLPVFAGIMAIVGHTFSVFVGFRGGKGVATAAGMLLALAPWAVLASAVLWAIVVKASGYVSLGSILAALSFPAADYLLHAERRSAVTLVVDVGIAGYIIWRHRTNIQRLLNGTENRFGRKQAAPQAP